MAKQLQLRQGTTTEHNTFTGAVGEVTVDTTKDTLVVHDGVTAGGFPVASKANADGTISLIKKDGTSAGTINADGLFNNTLTSTNTNQALTAAQGKVLKDTLDTTTSSTFGVDQTWRDLTSSRVSGVNYTNSTGKAITIAATSVGRDAIVSFYVNDVLIYRSQNNYAGAVYAGGILIVPNGATYRVDAISGYGSNFSAFMELK